MAGEGLSSSLPSTLDPVPRFLPQADTPWCPCLSPYAGLTSQLTSASSSLFSTPLCGARSPTSWVHSLQLPQLRSCASGGRGDFLAGVSGSGISFLQPT